MDHPLFPNSFKENFILTSPQDQTYNCIAWAYGKNNIRMWPSIYSFYWPPDISQDENTNSFIQLFSSIGYEICEAGELEEGYEKICIYEKNGIPQHAARQLDNGLWTSKLGPQWDISHTLYSMQDGYYGNIVVFMKRSK